MNQKLTWGSKLSFGMGAFGKDLVYAIVGTYFMKYLTDVRLVDPFFVAVLFMAARIWDAFNDPFMGMIVDNTRSRWGKFRPWILIGTLVNAVVLILLYLDVDLPAKQYAIYVGIMYLLWGMTYTIMDIPYWSMVPALTKDESERSQISAIPRFFASTAWLIVGSGGLYIVKYLGNGDQILGFSRFAIAIAVVFIGSTILTVVKVKEQSVATAGTGEKTGVKRMIKVLVQNDQVLVVLGIALFFNMAYQLSNSFAMYYFEYVCGVKAALYATYTGVGGFAQMAALAAFPIISTKIRKNIVFFLSSLLPAVGFVALLAAGYIAPKNIILVAVCSIIINLGIGFMLALVTVILSEAVDYGEYKLGTRNESIIFSTQTFVVKFAGAFSGFIAAAGLDVIGFVPNVEQGQGSIMGMRVIMIILPAILSVLCVLIYKRGYRLNEKFYSSVLKTLKEKKEAEPQN